MTGVPSGRSSLAVSDLSVVPDPSGAFQIAPTDIAQFIRLDQCQRYLRLRLHERSASGDFMSAHGVGRQPLPTLLTRSGERFERYVEQAVRARFSTLNLAATRAPGERWRPDNARVLEEIAALPPGATRVLFQSRLATTVAGWRLRGDVDIIRLERSADGMLDVLIVDMKSSSSAKVEHRLQVAFYHRMLGALLDPASLAAGEPRLGILYRGGPVDDPATAGEAAERAAAERLLGVEGALLEIVSEPAPYLDAVADLVTGPGSTAARIVAADFDALPFHLTPKCDDCLYNQFCMKWAAERDDLSLLPHITLSEKEALQRAGVRTVRDLAYLKEPAAPGATELVAAPGQEERVRALAVTWPVGPRLDDLVHRARVRRRRAGDPIEALPFLPNKGYSSLPHTAPDHNPNLICLYIDVQHDYLHDRIYLLGARVVAHERGAPARHRAVVHLTPGPPDTAAREEALFVAWIAETLRTIVELAAPDADGRPRAPIHLVFYTRFARQLLLDGLSRHLQRVFGATPLYDLVTQLAAFDSPVLSVLEEEIREQKTYPMVCQSLQQVAQYLRFDWGEDRQRFHERLFDVPFRLDPADPASRLYEGRARFGSRVPLEYAHGAWGELATGNTEVSAGLRLYQATTPDTLRAFVERRLAAMEHVARDLRGNPQTVKSTFLLPDLARFSDTATSLAAALHEFVTIEQHVALAEWKAARLARPETRLLAGHTLIVRYVEADQTPRVRERNRENAARRMLNERYRDAYRRGCPEAKSVRLPKEQREESAWSWEGMRFRLRLECAEAGCTIEQALALTTLKEGTRLVICPRWEVDSRLPPEQRVPFAPTVKQMLHGLRGDLTRLIVERDADGVATGALVEVTVQAARATDGGRGFVFSTMASMNVPFEPDALYTLDEDPNNWTGFWAALVTDELRAGQPNTLHARLVAPDEARVAWPPAAAAAQARFLEGLAAADAAGLLHPFEPSKRDFIARHGDTPVLLVQGPPGTGKSYATGFALYARLQGALAAGRAYRVVLSCKTHAATDVLLSNLAHVRGLLDAWRRDRPDLFAAWFDPRVLEVPLYRFAAPGAVPPGVTGLAREEPASAVSLLHAAGQCVLAATPGGVYRLIKSQCRTGEPLSGHQFVDCLVLDEASQMNLPEACLAALPLAPDGHLIVVGDHRQMPPIVRHDWENEPRRTFQTYRAFASLFETLVGLNPPMIKFAESFRLHADMAAFLRREIYQQDGIDYHSRKRAVLARGAYDDDLVAAVLAPEHPIVVVVHDEDASQVVNPFEQALIAPVLAALADPAGHGLEPEEGLGVVVPHRAQRAALVTGLPSLSRLDESGAIVLSAVDTVERFQGDERTVIVVSATESDREYLLASSKFLLDPRRLTVALSRARQKMILVAARSVFSLFSADDETFAHAQLWKNLLRRACTVPLWRGERLGRAVEVWGNAPLAEHEQPAPGHAPLAEHEQPAPGHEALA